jgi:hypothetical protein
VQSDHAERCFGHVIGGCAHLLRSKRVLRREAGAYEVVAAQIERIANPQETWSSCAMLART